MVGFKGFPAELSPLRQDVLNPESVTQYVARDFMVYQVGAKTPMWLMCNKGKERKLTGNVENGRKPVVLLATEVEILVQPSNGGIPEIGAVQHAQRVQQEDQRHDVPVQRPDDSLLLF